MKNLLAVSLLLWSFGQPVQAQTKKEALEYRMPSDVERRENNYHILQSRGEVGYDYFSNKTHRRVAFEKYEKGVLVERKLYDPDQNPGQLLYPFRLHGVQKEWYVNGVLKKWSPYFHGEKEGVFKEWDEQGRKVTQYTLKEGTGVEMVYSSTGELVRMSPLKRDARDGWQVFSEGGFISILNNKMGSSQQAYGFYKSGRVRHLTFFSALKGDNSSILQGPAIDWDKNGEIEKVVWFYRDRETTEQIYARKLVQYPQLFPPYYADKSKYLKLVSKKAHELFKWHSQLKPVKIPLQTGDPDDVLPVPAPSEVTRIEPDAPKN